MELDTQEIDVCQPSGGQKWYSSKAVSPEGKAVSLNIQADTQETADTLAMVTGISRGLSMHQRAVEVGKWSDNEEFID